MPSRDSCGHQADFLEIADFQSTKLYTEITEKHAIPKVAKIQDGVDIYPMIIGDSVFHLQLGC